MMRQHFGMPLGRLYMGIYLCRGDAFMPQHFLNDTQVRTILDQMGRKGMTESMRGNLLPHSCRQSLSLDHLEYGRTAQRTAEAVQEDKVIRSLVTWGRTMLEICIDRICSHLSDRHQPLLVSFSYDTDESFIEVQAGNPERNRLLH